MTPPRVVVFIEGGVLRGALSNRNDLEVLLIDYDVEGTEPHQLANTPAGDPAWVVDKHVEVDAGKTDQHFKLKRSM